MNIAQSITFVSAILGLIGTASVVFTILRLDFEGIYNTTGDRKGFWSNETYSTLELRQYTMFGTLLLSLSYIVQLLGLLVNTDINIEINGTVLFALTIIFVVLVFVAMRLNLKNQKFKVKKREEEKQQQEK